MLSFLMPATGPRKHAEVIKHMSAYGDAKLEDTTHMFSAFNYGAGEYGGQMNPGKCTPHKLLGSQVGQLQ